MVNALLELGNATLNPLAHIWNNIIYYIPGIIGAIIVGLVGYFIGLLLGRIVKKALVRAKLDEWIHKNNFSKILLNIKLSNLSGQLVKWGIFIVFLSPAANLIKLDTLSALLTQFALWFPNLVLAIIIVVVGLIVSKLVEKQINMSKTKVSEVVSNVIQIIIIVLFLDVALKQIGVRIEFIETVILLIVGAVLLTVAIALGIGLSTAIKKNSDKIINSFIIKQKDSKKKK